MPRYFAFLRGINLGNRNVKMDRLRAIIGELGFDDVSSFLASGNVIFDTDETDAAALERRIESHLADSLGYDVATFLRTRDELAAIADHDAFPDVDGEPGALNVVLLRGPAGEELVKGLAALESDADRFRAVGREIWWRSETRMSQSPAWAPFTKLLPDDSTTRNVNTMRRLIARFGDG